MKQKQQKIKIGIVGEHPNNDALALSQLLKTVAVDNIEFIIMQKNNRGGRLDSVKFFKDLRAEYRAETPQYIILIRDLDGLISEIKKIQERDMWFANANREIQNCGIFFLAIYEMEALILSDIESFNKYYGLKTKPIGNPSSKEKPKEFLEKLTSKTQKGKYDENDAIKIFQKLNFRTVYDAHKGERSFQTFANELRDKKLIQIL